MSNYYKGSISLSPNKLSAICKGILTPNGSTIPDISNNYFKQLGLPIVSATFSGVNTINEKPNSLGYLYNGTDISQYCIAPYVESNGTTFTSIPTWCKNIRAILIGAGGNGASGTLGSHQYNNRQQHIHLAYVRNDNNDHDGINHRNKHDPSTGGYHVGDWNLYESHRKGGIAPNEGITHNKEVFGIYSQNNTLTRHALNYDAGPYYNQASGQKGGTGGGGAFIFLNSINVESSTISITGGGTSQSTSLSVTQTNISGTTKYEATKGANAVSIISGNGGTVTVPTTLIIDVSGNGKNGNDSTTAGSSGFHNYSSTFPYGNAGVGGAGGLSGDNPTPSPGTNGQAGYYRIYFLT
jgi:hypothetical protein